MFTGLISEVATVTRIETRGGVAALQVHACEAAKTAVAGDSVAINGACLTANEVSSDKIVFDVSNETLKVANIDLLKIGDKVNVELALKVGDRLGGHFVLGHVDCLGLISKAKKPSKTSEGILELEIPNKYLLWTVEKGSIAVNGISLTIQSLQQNKVKSIVIPHTWANTNLELAKKGDYVNVEFDLIVKAVIRSTKGIIGDDQNISFDKLSEWGY